MKKYELWNDEDIVYDTDNVQDFNVTVMVNYPLGDFISVYDLPDWTTINFMNYKIIINKGVKEV